jgi:hypothetical protein
MGLLALVFGISFSTVPWFIYNWNINGSPFASTAYLQIAANFYDPQSDEFITSLTAMKSQFSSLSEVILSDPIKVISKYLQDILFLNIPKLFIPKNLLNTLHFPIYQLVISVHLLLVNIGFFCLFQDIFKTRDRFSKKKLTFIFVNLLGYLILGLVGFHRRYYFFMFPLIFASLLYPLFHEKFPSFARWISIAILFVLLSVAAGVETKLNIASQPTYLLEIANFLKKHSLPHEIIVVRKPHLAYLSGLKGAFPLAKNANEYLVKAREIKARYIVYSDYEASLWPGLKSLSNPQGLPPAFKLIYQHQPTNTSIYDIN